MDVNLNTIKDHFPEWSSSIERLYQKNASFHSLCDDYLLVVERIKQCGSPEVSISSADLVELKTLLSELEQEMNIYFNEA
jgi:uncharacterized protein YdcH (DUF465 family)